MTRKLVALLHQITRRRLLIISSFIFVLFLITPAIASINIETEAKIIVDAMKAGELVPLSTLEEEEKTEDNVYKIQEIVFKSIIESNNDSVAGYKGAITAAAQIARFKAPGPATAPLLKSGLTEIKDVSVPLSLEYFPGMMLEAEFTFKTAVPITSPVKDEEELKKLIASVHASIEIPKLYFTDMSKLGFFDLVSAGAGSKNFVVGTAHNTDLDVDSMQVIMTRDGTVVIEGKGTDVLGGPWKSLLWMVNNILVRQGPIEAGQYLMTGAMGSMIPAQPGEYVLTFPFETLKFEVKE